MTLHVADLSIESASRRVSRGGSLIQLTRTEYNLLHLRLIQTVRGVGYSLRDESEP
jgi:DNA-binding response OmpR family regulator